MSCGPPRPSRRSLPGPASWVVSWAAFLGLDELFAPLKAGATLPVLVGALALGMAPVEPLPEHGRERCPSGACGTWPASIALSAPTDRRLRLLLPASLPRPAPTGPARAGRTCRLGSRSAAGRPAPAALAARRLAQSAPGRLTPARIWTGVRAPGPTRPANRPRSSPGHPRRPAAPVPPPVQNRSALSRQRPGAPRPGSIRPPAARPDSSGERLVSVADQ